MQDQDNDDLREDRGLTNLSPPFSSCAPPETSSEANTSIPAIVAGKVRLAVLFKVLPASQSCTLGSSPSNTSSFNTEAKRLTMISQKHLDDRLYSPQTFRAWIRAGITAAREDYQETAEIDRTDAMKTNRRIFECLDAATEKNLDRIRDKKAALELLDAVNWDDLMGGGYVDTRRRGAAKQASGERYQGFGNFKQMTVEKARMKVQRAADEAGAKEIK